MKNRFIIISVFVIPLLLYWAMSVYMPQKADEFKKSYQVNAQANKNGAKIIKFYTPMCLDCQKLDKTLNKVMPKYSNKIYLEKIDASSRAANIQVMIKKFGIKVVPTTLFINSKGEIVNKVEGDIPQQELEKQIRAIY